LPLGVRLAIEMREHIVSGFIQCGSFSSFIWGGCGYSLQRNIDLESTEQPLHQLLPPTPPSTRELINAFLEAPAGVFSAAKYFEEQLCRSSSLREQLTAPLMAADCTSLPFFDDLKFGFTMPPAFARMSPPELDLAKKYQTSMYKQSKRSRTDPLKK
jgi:hypothetical protein